MSDFFRKIFEGKGFMPSDIETKNDKVLLFIIPCKIFKY